MQNKGFEKAFSRIKENRERAKNGNFNCIPFGLSRFEKHVPGIMQEIMYLVTANSGIGKSQLTKNMFVRTPISFVEENPDSGISVKIFYFALEESEEEFYNFLISARLKEQFNIDIAPIDLLSFNNTLSENIIEKIAETRNYFKSYNKYVEVIDYISNPYGIFKHVRDYARKHGKFFFKGIPVDPLSKNALFDEYVPNNPNEYVIVIVDHVSLLQPENGMTLHQTITKWSAEYCRKQLSKNYKYVVVNVQQQSADKLTKFVVECKIIEYLYYVCSVI